MKKPASRIALRRQTLRSLDRRDLEQASGGTEINSGGPTGSANAPHCKPVMEAGEP